jgi:hypothetical protein
LLSDVLDSPINWIGHKRDRRRKARHVYARAECCLSAPVNYGCQDSRDSQDTAKVHGSNVIPSVMFTALSVR